MHRPTCWRTALRSLPKAPSDTSRVAGRRYKSSFATRTAAKGTGTLLRWGLAGAAVYYYNTSNVFAEEPRYANAQVGDRSNPEPYTSIDTIAAQRRAQAKQTPSATPTAASVAVAEVSEAAGPSPIESPEGLEEEAQQQGAFNEETGEINWDCPCLGGMAHGPCGEQFKAAFSCFVFSKEEPKGVDCIEHFKTMQNCFREHPDIYGAELTDDADEGEYDADESAAQPGPAHAVEVARESINDTVEKTADAIRGDASQVTEAVKTAVPASKEQHTAGKVAPRG